ncbi:penicillin-binding transpeptidase domain-containing protein [Amycolatopsis sp. PS_44_ISF1]|uniref:penicillin-binding transpeptidase domain-containing protein n=1 Tax=Amycolatopsis sp. PS_44_ISF1 TaxID=2974917 RepID=UPI0028DEF058|nr:penicillin-binding transpeptidase domain-containing protein [Amycolatopsis sp. PS_44_ISF1]MDT8914884.1 penicillin-binding transpeptidase domain-containing protein [Amycolatopsis sp. PS_44_ISF1]
MSPAGRRRVLIGGAVAVVAIVVAAVVLLSGGDPAPAASSHPEETTVSGVQASDPASAAKQYLRAFASGDADTASRLTDDPPGSAAVLRDAWSTLKPAGVRAELGPVGAATGPKATAAYTTTWTLAAGRVWSYDGTFDVVRSGSQWRVHWTPAVLEPKLEAGQRLVVATAAAEAPAVIDRDGKPILVTGPGGPHAAGGAAFPLLSSALTGQVHASASDSFAVERVDTSGRSLETLFGKTTGGFEALKSTLSVGVQSAAQSAVDSFGGKAVIVAIQPSNGGILAVAQNAGAGTGPSALSGLYAPGSTFKIATATAALEAGTATPDAALPCPLTARIGTRTLSNEDFDLGTVPMHRAFAKSCNTTFGTLASQLPADGLANAATQFGLNADFDIPGIATETGEVVPAQGADEQVEDGIGQGTVQVSPFGEALMAATVAAGRAVTPRLWTDPDRATKVSTRYSAPPAGVLASVRSMMREVVTGGTATGLARSGTVFGKTGTAQFGSGAEAHGWFTGYRGDLAFVVFLEGANDSGPAVTLGAKFLAGVK